MFGRRKNKKLAPEFSLELQAFMGAWATYSAYNAQVFHYNHLQDENISAIEFFENNKFNSDVFSENFSMLIDLKILDLGSSKPKCKYDDVKDTILHNLHNIEKPIINYFLEMASSLLVDSEHVSFEVAVKCLPLFKTFENEGYIRFENEKCYWTKNIRPIMEKMGYWRPKNYSSPETQYLKKIPWTVRKSLDECAARCDIISGAIILRRLPEVQSRHGMKESHKLDPMLIMRALYPQVWPEEKKPVLWN